MDEFKKILKEHDCADDKGNVKDSLAYSKCQMERQKFSYIRKGMHKPTKFALFHIAVGLRFTFEETNLLLHKLGYCFSDASVLDRIIQFYLEDGNPDIYEVDEELKKNGLPCFIKEDEDIAC